MADRSQKIGVYRFMPVRTCPGKPDNFIPIISAALALFKGASKANDKDIAKNVGGLTDEASNKLVTHGAVSDALLAETLNTQLNERKKDNTTYIIIGVAILLIIIIGIILFKRK